MAECRADYQASIKAPFAHLGIRLLDERLAAIDFISSAEEIAPPGAAANDICNCIRQYIDDPHSRCHEHIACTLSGTAFQQQVWNALIKIPPGKVVSYGELAKQLGTSARAVGNACRRNPIPLVIPCHRVVAANSVGGYAGDTRGGLLKIKKWLLKHEGVDLD